MRNFILVGSFWFFLEVCESELQILLGETSEWFRIGFSVRFLYFNLVVDYQAKELINSFDYWISCRLVLIKLELNFNLNPRLFKQIRFDRGIIAWISQSTSLGAKGVIQADEANPLRLIR